MDSRLVHLPPDLVEQCERYGAAVVARYAAGYNAGSRALSSHGAERNIGLQARGKMAECGLCHFLGGDPEHDLNWSGYSDPGLDYTDIVGRRYDVKATSWRATCLIWPINKNHILASEPFDVLVLVKVQPPVCLIAGYIKKQAFLETHKTAAPGHKLDAGTWFVEERDLSSPRVLRLWRGYLPPKHPYVMEPAEC